ncbi:ketoacyl-ACP synthase III family protein [Nocardia arthritidis]|uniref:3-oxoacyl-ACP synthase n=1 Tax=Nocardia arthritidis TaxID=228602 RepID=A0A6G9Y9P5_9NOCA|nr:ketoacyl-ACP synthase III family protein [Nocardia arthritidis]QIS09874.1 3-oxoacyl-ACP synthase [Nocardia arthritidis]
MRWNDIYIDSCAAKLGRRENVGTAVEEGRYDAKEAAVEGYWSVCVADQGPAIAFAVTAAERALKRTEVAPPDFVIVLHSSCSNQGLDHFAPASYVQGRTIGGVAAAMEVKQYSNGGLAALEIGAAYLQASSKTSAALLTTSDIFALPAFDRYRSDKGVVFGDGGTGLVLTRRSGVAKLLSTNVISDGTYGAVYIGNDIGTGIVGSDTVVGPVDLRARRKEYLIDNMALLMKVVESMTKRQCDSVRGALADADLSCRDIDRWILTNVGQSMVDRQFNHEFAIEEVATTWNWGREVGHLGAADQIAGLTYLLETGALNPGDRVALCGVGMGFTYACAVLEIIERPEWSLTAA